MNAPYPHDAPTLSALSPSLVAAGSPALTLTIDGAGFITSSKVRWNGIDLATTFVSSTRLTAAVPADHLSSVGQAAITVFTRSPGGGTSSAQTLDIFVRAPLDGLADGVLGQPDFFSAVQNNPRLQDAASRLAGTTGVVIDLHSGRLFVSDKYNHRVLSWPNVPAFANAQAADLVLGQPDLKAVLPNQGGSPTEFTLKSPEGLALDARGNLFVADMDNNRVLEFAAPFSSGMAAVSVFGQVDFTSTLVNQGLSVSASGLNVPVGVAVDDLGNLYVADQNNNRVLVYNAPLVSGKPADRVVGQPGFSTADSNLGKGVSADSLWRPVGVAVDPGGNLFVSDSANNRILEYSSPVPDAKASAYRIFGQPDATSNLDNQGVGPDANTLSLPGPLVFDSAGNLVVSDSGNHRVLRYRLPFSTNMPASGVIGQANLAQNAFGLSRQNMTFPFGLALDAQDNLYVADYGNSRLLEFDLPFAHSTPVVTTLNPSLVADVEPDFILNVYGAGFVPGTTILWNNGSLPTTFVSRGQLQTVIAGKTIASGGPFAVRVFTPAPGGGDSNTPNLTLYARAGSDVLADGILGQPDFDSGPANNPALPGWANRLNHPSQMVIDQRSGRLFVSDTDNNRVLSWPSLPAFTNGQAADLVIGQSDLSGTRPQGGLGSISDAGLNAPAGLALDVEGSLFVADQKNNRVLAFRAPFSTGMHAFLVLGQPDFNFGLANWGGLPSEFTLSGPTGVFADAGGDLFVADSGNNRVLNYLRPFSNGVAAIFVLGQPNFLTNSPNQGGPVGANTLNHPTSLLVDASNQLFVADRDNNRVLVFAAPVTSGKSASLVFGQPGFVTNLPNQNSANPSASSLNSPTGLALDAAGNLLVADALNNRVVGFFAPLHNAMPASLVLGQAGFTTAASGTSRTALSKPVGVALDAAGNVYAADNLNNRIVEYDSPAQRPVPTLLGLSPASVTAGAPDFTLAAVGTGFSDNSILRWNGTDLPTIFVSSSQLSATIPAANVTAVGSFPLTVFTPAPGGGTSNSLNLDVFTRAALDTTADGVLGQPDLTASAPNNPLLPGGENRLKQPEGVVVDPVSGRLFAADTANNRVLSWPNMPAFTNGQAADLVLGQDNFFELRSNRGGAAGAATLAAPGGLALDAQGSLYVADTGNHRVLMYPAPFTSGMPASLVIGQPNFTFVGPNQGVSLTEYTLWSPSAVAVDALNNLFVADTGNNRVLRFDAPLSSSMAAGLVFGQADFITGDPNMGGAVLANRLNQPGGLVVDFTGNLFVADTNNHRITIYNAPLYSSMSANLVIGQPGWATGAANQGGAVSQSSLSAPKGLTLDFGGKLYVADSANNRVLAYTPPFATGMPASQVYGQANYSASAANRGGSPSPNTLSGPVAVALDAQSNLYISDSGNNRLLEYDTPLTQAAPSMSYTSPTMLPMGSEPVVVTVNGSSFYPTSVVRWNGADRPTTFISNMQLSAAIPASDLAAGGTVAVTVFTPAPGGGLSAAFNLAVYARSALDGYADNELGQVDFYYDLQNSTMLPGGANRLYQPSRVAVDKNSGRLFVADQPNSRVLSWPSALAYANGQAADLVIGQPDFNRVIPYIGFVPHDVAVDSHGNLYVTNLGTNSIFEYNAPLHNGAAPDHIIGQAGAISASTLLQPSGLAIDLFDNLYVSDTGNGRVLVFNSPLTGSGNASVVIGSGSFFSAGNLNALEGLAVDDQGNLYIAESGGNRVLEYLAPLTSGMSASLAIGQPNLTSVTGRSGQSGLLTPKSVALDSFGNLYVADYNNNRVMVFTVPLSTGMPASQVIGQPNFISTTLNSTGLNPLGLAYPTGVALDAQNNLFVADWYNNRVLEYDRPVPTVKPSLNALSPDSVAAGSSDFVVTINGAGFRPDSVVRWNGVIYPSAFLDSGRMKVFIPAQDSAAPGLAAVTVANPAPGGGESTPLNLTIYTRAASDVTADGEMGQPGFQTGLPNNLLLPDNSGRLYDPSGVVVDPQSGRLFVADSSNHRVLSWANAPAFTNAQPADLVIGQADLNSTALNRGGLTAANTLFSPTGLALDAQGNLYVADSGNNRVLEYDAPLYSGMDASRVFGQAGSFTSFAPLAASADSLYLPVSVALDGQGNLFVADSFNNRVLEYFSPLSTDTTADLVIGQNDFGSAGSVYPPISSKLTHPGGVAVDAAGNLYVSDTNNNRVLEYNAPLSVGQAATRVYGQLDFVSAAYLPVSSASLFEPAGLRLTSSGALFVADTGNSRVLGYSQPLVTAAADRVFGQPDMTSNTQNNGGLSASTLAKPFSLAFDAQGSLYVADRLNHRLLEYDTPVSNSAPGLTALSPNTMAAGGTYFSLNVQGTGFYPTSVVRWNGIDLYTFFSSPTRLDAYVPGSVYTASGTAAITVFTPAPGGGVSAALNVSLYQRAATDTAADLVLGQPDFHSVTANNPLLPDGSTRLNRPDGIMIDPATGRLFVADANNNRVLSWSGYPEFVNGQAADLLIGQVDFNTTAINRGGTPSASSLNFPTALGLDSQGNLYVADYGNNRVLEYNAPLSSGMPADRVFGQPNFTTTASNSSGVNQNSLYQPTSLTLDAQGNLYVTDSFNHRVLEYNTPLTSDTSADLVLGQANFTSNTFNRGGQTTASTLYHPSGVVLDAQGNLYVSDNVNYRILRYSAPFSNGMAASLVLGQANFSDHLANRGSVKPSANSLNLPQHLIFDPSGNLYVADYKNSRVLVYMPPFVDSMNAAYVFGQPDFVSNTPDAGGASASTLNGPAGLNLDASGSLYVSDYESHRVLVYDQPLSTLAPVLTALNPNTLPTGGPAFELMVNGSGFYANSIVRWNGSDRPTTYLDHAHLTAAILASDVASGGPFAVTVFTPAPGGGTSNTLNLSLYTSVVSDNMADRVLGQPDFLSNASNNPVMSGASRLYYPGGIVVDPLSGRLYVADAYNHRVLSWPNAPAFANGQPADLVLGQPNFGATSPNQGGAPSAYTLWYPYDVALDAQGNLYVADDWNNRVLEYDAPLSSSMAASRVFGQPDFVTNAANAASPSANSLQNPTMLVLDAQGSLYVADFNNHRILKYNTPLLSDTAADLVLGQAGFAANSANRGGTVSASSLNNPMQIALDAQGNLYAADMGNSRVLRYDAPLSSGMAASLALGQANLQTGSANQGGAASAATLNKPRSLAIDRHGNLYVADTLNSRVLVYRAPLSTGAAAFGVLGQLTFSGANPNTGGVTSQTLWYPDGLALDAQGNLYVADSNNNRVLEYDWAWTYGAALTPPARVQAGGPGQVLTYTLQVANTGNTLDAFQLSLLGGAWAAQVQPASLTIAAGASASVSVRVTIPADAVSGAQNSLTVSVVSQSDAAASASAALTTLLGAEVTAPPAGPVTLVYTDTQNKTTTVQLPAGAVTTTTTIIYTPVSTVTNPTGFSFAGHAFNLDAYQNNQPLAHFVFSTPVLVTVHYTDSDILGLDENALALQYWNPTAGAWQDAACGAYTRSPAENWFSVPICHLSDFAVFAKNAAKNQLFLPFVKR